MGYLPNTIQWTREAIVIHHADAKEPKMLMKIIGFTRDGLAKCQYVDRNRGRKIYPNAMTNLLNPYDFELNPDWGDWSQESLNRTQDEWERVRNWNFLIPVGSPVKTTSADGGFETVTVGAAMMMGDGSAYIYLEQGGMWLLKHVEALPRLEPVRG